MAIPALQIIAQRYHSDCSVACLAMICGVGYEEALGAFRHNVCVDGASIGQIQRAATRLKTPLTYTKPPADLDDVTGILDLQMGRKHHTHVVVAHRGFIIDVDPEHASLWDYDVYMAAYPFKPLGLLVRREKK